MNNFNLVSSFFRVIYSSCFINGGLGKGVTCEDPMINFFLVFFCCCFCLVVNSYCYFVNLHCLFVSLCCSFVGLYFLFAILYCFLCSLFFVCLLVYINCELDYIFLFGSFFWVLFCFTCFFWFIFCFFLFVFLSEILSPFKERKALANFSKRKGVVSYAYVLKI